MKDDNRLWESLVALVFLTAIWTGFLLGARWLWLRLDAFGPFERSSLFVIPGFVMIGLGIGWLERFLPVHGIIMGARLLFPRRMAILICFDLPYPNQESS